MPRLLLAGAALLFAAAAQAADTFFVPVPPSAQAPERDVRLETFVYEASGTGPHPLLVFLHGSSGGEPRASLRARRMAEFFTARGFTVVVPMRRGRGASSGVSLESEEKNCDTGSWRPGIQAALADVSAAIDFARKLPRVDPSRVVLAGASRGGFLAVAYAAEGSRRDAIVGAINLVGGWVAQAEDQCPVDFNTLAFGQAGRTSAVAALWLYGERDPYYAEDSVRSYADAFRAAGGRLRFRLIAGVPGHGHRLPEHPRLWAADVDDYLRSIGLPTAGG